MWSLRSHMASEALQLKRETTGRLHWPSDSWSPNKVSSSSTNHNERRTHDNRNACVCVCVCVSHSVMSDSATPWTKAHQAPLAMEFSGQEYWSSLPFPSPGDLPNPGIKPGSPALQADSLRSEFIACIFQAQRQTPSAK